MTNHPQNENIEIIRADGTINEKRLSKRLKTAPDMLEAVTIEQKEAAGILADLSAQVEVALKEKGKK